MSLSHNRKQYNSEIINKTNFVFWKKINKFKNDPINELINIVQKNKFSFLYESVEKGREKGRYTICGFDSINTIILKKNKLSVQKFNKKKISIIKGNPLTKIENLIKSSYFKKNKKLPPMVGSFFGYLSYENIYKIEKISNRSKKNTLKTPDIILFIPKILIIHDNITKSLYLIRHNLSNEANKPQYDFVLDEFIKIEERLKTKFDITNINLNKKKKIKIKSNIKKNKFIRNINIAKSYIKNGDIFQVVPSQRFETNYIASSSTLYRVLRITNPSPFMYYFNLPNFHVVGSSPEILVRIRSKTMTIRPIAGTRPRGKNIKQDKMYEHDLLKDKKEVAEHLMLLDLGRNDVGKVSKKSSVTVTSKFIIERYSHVMHIVSNVIGKLKDNISPITALMAGFPAGTVSGAPKIRAMQIIDELEDDSRGIYGGGIGYISPDGDMDTCIVLRTGIITNKKLYVQAGGGIVYDSNPEMEFKETVNKAKAVLNAASIALGNIK